MKILIVGNIHVHFLSELANRLESEERDVYILDFATLQLRHHKLDDTYYKKQLQSYSKIKFLDRLMRPLLINKILKKYDFDIVNFQFLYWHYIFSVLTFKKIRAKVFFTIFGSDFYRAGGLKKKYIYPLILKAADGVIFTNQKTKDDFLDVYPFVSLLKTDVCRLGLPALEHIDKHRVNRETFYEYFNIPNDKMVITVGYNLTPQQQHIKAIDAINRLSEEEREKVHVLFPLTYGGTQLYLNELRSYLKSNAGFKYTILTQYMDNDEISKLRVVTDVMINILITDQFSGSMQEHLYAGNVIIAGEWLPYETMIQQGVTMQRIQDVADLPGTLSYVLAHLSKLKAQGKQNPEHISELSSWENVISCWENIFDV